MKLEITLMVLYILATIWMIVCWIYVIHNFLSDNEENIERWGTAIVNFLWEKYTDFVDEYAPTE